MHTYILTGQSERRVEGCPIKLLQAAGHDQAFSRRADPLVDKVRSAEQSNEMNIGRLAYSILAASAVFVVSANPARAAEPPGPPSCPPGLPHTMTLEQALERYAGYFTEEQIRASFAENDLNGNGYGCYRTPAFGRFDPFVVFIDDLEDQGPA